MSSNRCTIFATFHSRELRITAPVQMNVELRSTFKSFQLRSAISPKLRSTNSPFNCGALSVPKLRSTDFNDRKGGVYRRDRENCGSQITNSANSTALVGVFGAHPEYWSKIFSPTHSTDSCAGTRPNWLTSLCCVGFGVYSSWGRFALLDSRMVVSDSAHEEYIVRRK